MSPRLPFHSGSRRPSSAEDGSALVTVLVLVAIASTLVGLVLSHAALRHRFVQRDVHRLQARYVAETGVVRALDRLDGTLRPLDVVLDVEGEGGQTIPCSVHVEPFGLLARVRATASVRGERWTIGALAGMTPPPAVENALVFGDDRSNLTLTGSTRVTGPLHVGARGVETSSLRGQRFTGAIEGDVDRDPQVALPTFDDAGQNVLDRAGRWLRSPPPGARASWENPARAARHNGRRVFYVDGGLSLSAADQSVFDAPALVLATGDVSLEGALTLAPGSIVVAGRTLRVAGDVRGSNVLLVGRKGVFAGGRIRLSAQLVSESQIAVGGEARFDDPSLAYVERPDGRVRLSGTAHIDGWVLVPNTSDDVSNRDPEVVVSDSASVRGALYNVATTELHGTVLGSVLARRFAFYQSPTHYVNWVKDAVVDVTRRPAPFVAPFGFDASPRPQIITWSNEQRPFGSPSSPTANR